MMDRDERKREWLKKILSPKTTGGETTLKPNIEFYTNKAERVVELINKRRSHFCALLLRTDKYWLLKRNFRYIRLRKSQPR